MNSAERIEELREVRQWAESMLDDQESDTYAVGYADGMLDCVRWIDRRIAELTGGVEKRDARIELLRELRELIARNHPDGEPIRCSWLSGQLNRRIAELTGGVEKRDAGL